MAKQIARLGWDDFRLIKSVAEAKSLPAAAQMLRIDHSTVFRRLRQIERNLGVQMFERHREGYVPTAAGEEAVQLASRMDEDITALTRKLSGQKLSPAGELRITTNDSLLIDLLSPLLAKFRQQCQDVRLDVVLSNQALNLSRRDADIAIRATNDPPETLVGKKAATIAWALYGSRTKFVKPRPLSPERYAEHVWAAPGDHLETLKSARFLQRTVPPEQIGYRVNTILGLTEAVAHGIGIGHLPCFIGDRRQDLVRLSSPVADFATELWLLTHQDLRNTPRVRVFMDFLGDQLARSRKLIEGKEPGSRAPQVRGQ